MLALANGAKILCNHPYLCSTYNCIDHFLLTYKNPVLCRGKAELHTQYSANKGTKLRTCESFGQFYRLECCKRKLHPAVWLEDIRGSLMSALLRNNETLDWHEILSHSYSWLNTCILSEQRSDISFQNYPVKHCTGSKLIIKCACK